MRWAWDKDIIRIIWVLIANLMVKVVVNAYYVNKRWSAEWNFDKTS